MEDKELVVEEHCFEVIVTNDSSRFHLGDFIIGVGFGMLIAWIIFKLIN